MTTALLAAWRLRGFSSTGFDEMSEPAARTGAIDLGQGFPDTDGPAWIRQAAVRALRDGRGSRLLLVNTPQEAVRRLGAWPLSGRTPS